MKGCAASMRRWPMPSRAPRSCPHGFGREAERVKETADSAATSFSRVVEGLREAAESARVLIAETRRIPSAAPRISSAKPWANATSCLRAASSVAEQAEKARAILAKAAEDAERHIVSLPGIAQQEAAHVREAMRQETELMLDMSARTLATLQSRVQKRAARAFGRGASSAPRAAARAAAGAASEGLRGLARRITGGRTQAQEPKSVRSRAINGRTFWPPPRKAANTKPRAEVQRDARLAAERLWPNLPSISKSLRATRSDPALWRRWLDGDQHRVRAPARAPRSGRSRSIASPRFTATISASTRPPTPISRTSRTCSSGRAATIPMACSRPRSSPRIRGRSISLSRMRWGAWTNLMLGAAVNGCDVRDR